MTHSTPQDDVNVPREWLACSRSPAYFAANYVSIYNATTRGWMRLNPWPSQHAVINDLLVDRFFLLLKARQLGMSWIVLAYFLWLMLFRPQATLLIMSKRDDEAKELLAERLTKMHDLLPKWMQAKSVLRRSAHHFELSNGSRAIALPTSGGRSYTATAVLLDEADFIPDLVRVLNAIKPTADAGGQLILISTVDKEQPTSTFKQMFRAAYFRGASNYHAIFLSWRARPERTMQWYEAVKDDMFEQTASNDNLYQEYPATVEQALAPLELGKRFPFKWIEACTEEVAPLPETVGPTVPGLLIFEEPGSASFVIGADPAEGNPNSDGSALTVLNAHTWAEAASLNGQIEPDTLASYIDMISEFFNNASVLPERNNHGHALILALRNNGKTHILQGYDRASGNSKAEPKYGWLSTRKGKTLLNDLAAQVFRDNDCTIRTPETADQLAGIEGATLSAPIGLFDDRSDSYLLALAAVTTIDIDSKPAAVVPAPDPIESYDQAGWIDSTEGLDDLDQWPEELELDRI